MQRCGTATLCVCLALLTAGCPKNGKTEYSQGRKAEEISDYDAALTYYQQALKADPNNANLKIKVNQIRFEASNFHLKQGLETAQEGRFARRHWLNSSEPELWTHQALWRSKNCAGPPR